jgi:hypothetical protein
MRLHDQACQTSPRHIVRARLSDSDIGESRYHAGCGIDRTRSKCMGRRASKVDIKIPDQLGEQLSIADDGCGMTAKQFRQRWMTLGYNRPLHQGIVAEFPPERKDSRRPAYGRME